MTLPLTPPSLLDFVCSYVKYLILSAFRGLWCYSELLQAPSEEPEAVWDPQHCTAQEVSAGVTLAIRSALEALRLGPTAQPPAEPPAPPILPLPWAGAKRGLGNVV